jgi:hypothetical protein
VESSKDYARAVKEAHRNIRLVVRDDPRGTLIDREWIATNLADTREGVDSKWSFLAVFVITVPFAFLDNMMVAYPVAFLAAGILVESLSAVLVARRRTQRSAGELRQATLEARSLSTFVRAILIAIQIVAVLAVIAACVDSAQRMAASTSGDTLGIFGACVLTLVVTALSLATQRTAVHTPLPPRSDPSYLRSGFLRSMAIHDCLRRILVMAGLSLTALAGGIYGEEALQRGPLAVGLVAVSWILIFGSLSSPWRWMRRSVWRYADQMKVAA